MIVFDSIDSKGTFREFPSPHFLQTSSQAGRATLRTVVRKYAILLNLQIVRQPVKFLTTAETLLSADFFWLSLPKQPQRQSFAFHITRVCLAGGIPPWLGSMTSLEEIDLSATRLGGERAGAESKRMSLDRPLAAVPVDRARSHLLHL